MPDPSHVGVLRSGVDAWNAWRRENPSIRPDLSFEILSDPLPEWAYRDPVSLVAPGIDLSDANLTGAVIQHADLREADLSRADLTAADFRKADLRKASLRGAKLNHTKVSQSSAPFDSLTLT